MLWLADGTYRLVTYDLFNSGAANSLYRLSIRKEAPDFRLVAMVEGPLVAKPGIAYAHGVSAPRPGVAG